jgi:hypothetical protein
VDSSDGGRRPPRLDLAEGGGSNGALDPAEGGGGDDALNPVERGGGDGALDPTEVVVTARPQGRRGGEGGRCSWSWSPCATHGRGRHVPLVVVVVVVGAEVAHHRPPPPRHAATNRLRLAAANRLCLSKPSDITTTPSSRRGEPTAFDVGGTWCALPL